MRKAKKPVKTLEQNMLMFDTFVAGIETNAVPAGELLEFIAERSDAAIVRMAMAVAQIKNGNFKAAAITLRKIRAAIAPVARDYPFEPGRRVDVIRSEHGWHNGNLSGVVLERAGDSYVVATDDGYNVTVEHTRDMVAGY
jgi:hypothetical protein